MLCGIGNEVSHWQQSLLVAQTTISTLHFDLANGTSVLFSAAMHSGILRLLCSRRVTDEPAQANEVQVKACWMGLLGKSVAISLLLSALLHFRMTSCLNVT